MDETRTTRLRDEAGKREEGENRGVISWVVGRKEMARKGEVCKVVMRRGGERERIIGKKRKEKPTVRWSMK